MAQDRSAALNRSGVPGARAPVQFVAYVEPSREFKESMEDANYLSRLVDESVHVLFERRFGDATFNRNHEDLSRPNKSQILVPWKELILNLRKEVRKFMPGGSALSEDEMLELVEQFVVWVESLELSNGTGTHLVNFAAFEDWLVAVCRKLVFIREVVVVDIESRSRDGSVANGEDLMSLSSCSSASSSSGSSFGLDSSSSSGSESSLDLHAFF
jgi:hypothetical protein